MKILNLTLAALLTLPILAQTPAAPTPQQTAAAAQPSTDNTWWKHAVVYEIYPRSFKDSNGDGIGDLNGITSRLDYLQHLGVDAIWLAPIYPSPQVDFGYDISNYDAVDTQYGTLADFDHLLKNAQAHHIRIVMDMVMNHTSDKHPWFTESASSRTNPKADWYIWNDGKSTTDSHALNAHKGPHGWVVPPNNWSSLFQGSAWEWVEARQQFYYHFFYKQQPDLNYRNPAVEKAMFDAVKFWLDRGVAGFRLDAITTLYEVPTLQDEPLTGHLDASGFPESNHTLTSGLPEVHDFLQRLHNLVAGYPGQRVLIGEIYTPNTAALRSWYGTAAKPELELPMDTLLGFHQEGAGITDSANPSLDAAHFRKYITEAATELDGHTPLFVFDNHDQPRSWDRFTTADETLEQKVAIAKIIATVLYTTRDTALTYYGAELGMVTHTPTRKEDVQDPIGITGWPKEKGRDGERTPMQWTPGPQAGFSTNTHTWLPIGDEYKSVNVETESAESTSLLRWSEALTTMRRNNATLHSGGTIMVDNDNPNVLSYVRTVFTNSKPVLVTLNMTNKPQTLHLDLSAAHITSTTIKPLLTDAPSLNTITSLNEITLPPYTSFIAEIE
jgi:alpha-glucosidase